jgi:hypothetical protein
MIEATDNMIASFIPKTSIEEKPLWFFMGTAKVGKTFDGILIVRYTDSDKVEVQHGMIVIRKDGITFLENK